MNTSTIQFANQTSFFAPLVARVKSFVTKALSAQPADDSVDVWTLYRLAGTGDSVNARVADALAKRAQA